MDRWLFDSLKVIRIIFQKIFFPSAIKIEKFNQILISNEKK